MLKLPALALGLLLGLGAAAPCRAAGPGSVAVLSFENLTGDRAHDWIGFGFAETLTEKLSAVASLPVLGRRPVHDLLSSRGMDQRHPQGDDLRRTGEVLAVDRIVVGSVQLSPVAGGGPGQILVTARVVDGATARILDAFSVRGAFDALFLMQDDLSFHLAQGLAGAGSLQAAAGLRRHGTSSLEAYKLYILGNERLDARDYEAALRLYEAAQRKHPGIFYAEAHHNKGLALLRSGRGREMLEEFQRDAAQLSTVYYDLGIAYERQGLLDKAQEAYWTFLRYNANKTSPWRARTVGEAPGAPVAGGGAVFVVSGASVHALDAADGSTRWVRRLPAPGAASPLLAGPDLLVATRDGRLHRLDAAGGGITWELRLPGPVRLGPVLSGGRVCGVLDGGEAFAVEPGAEGLAWRRRLPFEPVGLSSGEGGVLFAAGAEGLWALGARDGKELWNAPGAGLPGPGPTSGTLAAGGRGGLQVLDRATGRPLWAHKGETTALPPVVAGDDVYFVSESGELGRLERPTGKVRWRSRLKGSTFFSLELSKDRLYVSSDAGVQGFEGGSGRQTQRWAVGSRLAARPALAEGRLFVGSEDGLVAAFDRGGSELGSAEVDAYLRIARLAAAQRRHLEAVEVYRYVVDQVKHNCPQAHYELAHLYRSLGRDEEARSEDRAYMDSLD